MWNETRIPIGRILVDRDLRELLGSAITASPGLPAVSDAQIQPASLDLRVGREAFAVRAGFLPERGDIESRIDALAEERLSLADGCVLAPGRVYLLPLAEQLALPPGIHGRFNPRSSAGRCDLFTRVLVPGHSRFDETPTGYAGPLWLEVAPLSFPVRLRTGDRLCQLRLQRGIAALTSDELRVRYAETPLCFVDGRPLPADGVRFDDDGGLLLGIGLAGREPCGWRATPTDTPIEFGQRGAHDRASFFEPVHATPDGRSILSPGRFTIFASRERIRVPPDLAAEMLPIDVGIGELRNNYAGFFDCGFGWREAEDAQHGTPAVLEVRAHDVPFEIEDGQAFFRLRFFRVHGRPVRLYGEGRDGPSYARQDLTLARCFR